MRLTAITLSLLVGFASVAMGADDASILFSDDFSTLDPAWGAASNNLSVAGGNMVIKADPNTGYTALYQGNAFGDVDTSVKLTQTSGNSDEPAGITFWAADQDNKYIAEFQSDGNLAVSRFQAGKWLTPVPWSVQAAVKKGLNQVNELRVVTQGRLATVYVNGTQVAAFNGFPPSGGSEIGLHAESAAQPYTWQFSNFVVRQPAPSQSPAPSTGTPDPSLLFSDNFAMFDPGWGTADDQHKVAGGKMVLTPTANAAYEILYQGSYFGDVDMTAKLIQINGGLSDSPAGVAFWGTDTSNCYVALVQGDGNFSVARYEAGKVLNPVPMTVQAAVNKGLDQVNEVRVVTKGRSATVFVNGTQVVSFNGFLPSGGSAIGLHAESGAQPYTWQFSDLVVRKPL